MDHQLKVWRLQNSIFGIGVQHLSHEQLARPVQRTLFMAGEATADFEAFESLVVALGRVAWTNVRPDGRMDVGVEFLEITEEDRHVVEGLFVPPAEPQ